MGAIGIQFTENDWEYPLWVITKGMADRQFRIEHVGIGNASGRLVVNDFLPCAVIRIGKNSQAYASFNAVSRGDILFDDVPGIKVDGFGDAQGPYPQWRLPKVRWMKRPVGEIEIEGLSSE